MLTSTRPNLKAQASTRQKTAINPRFTSPKIAITTLLARKSYAFGWSFWANNGVRLRNSLSIR